MATAAPEGSEQPELMTFLCDDCQLEFESLPDSTGYEQAACPQCQRICVRTDFDETAHHDLSGTFLRLVTNVLWWPATLVEWYRKRYVKSAEATTSAQLPEGVDFQSSGNPSNPYRPPKTTQHATIEESSAVDLNEQLLPRLSRSRTTLLFLSASCALISLYYVVGFAWAFVYMANSIDVWGWNIYELEYYGVLILFIAIRMFYLASLSFSLWCYAGTLIPDISNDNWPIAALAEAHEKVWYSVAFGVGLYLALAVLERLNGYALKWLMLWQ